jgi:class 3 adenylate cyclase/CBS domain-containing protein/putative methionine-R-sulfoxide reductase with GAF domain
MVTTVEDLLVGKGGDVWSINARASVFQALELMADKNVGALVVLDDGGLAGILSERDHARQVVVLDRGPHDTRVDEIMTRDLIGTSPAGSLAECMALMTEHRIRHLLVVDDGEPVGVISVGDVVKAVVAEQEALITDLEEHVAGSEAARSAKHEQREMAEALGEVSGALNSTLDLDDVLDLILDRVARVVPFSTGTIMMLEGEHAEVVRARGFDDTIVGLRLPLAEVTNLERVMRTGEPSLIGDTRASPDYVSTAETEHIRSAMTVAVRADGQVVGAISVDSDQQNAFSGEMLARLEAFADLAGGAVRNARVYRESQVALAAVREQRRLTQILADITAELMSQRDVDALLDFILERVSSFVAGAAVTVMLIRDGVAEVVRATPGEQALVGERLTVSDTPNLRQVFETRRPWVVDDTISADSGWQSREKIAWMRSNLTAPILLGGDVIGFLSLSSSQPGAFPETLFQPLEAFSNQVGIAIHNARVFAESEAARSAEHDQRQFAESLGEVSSALNGTLDLDDLLDLLLDRLARVVPFYAGSVLILDGDHAEVLRARGFDGSIVGLRLPLAEVTNLERVMKTGEPSLLNDTVASGEWTPTPETEHVRSAMTVAVQADGRVVGAISLDSDKKDAFSRELLTRLQAFAELAGSAVGNARLYQQSQEARGQSDRLLRAILPDQIAEELKANDKVRARRHENVAVLFADIVGFTQYCDTHDPEEVLEALAEITERFEQIAEAQGLEKLKTIGDSFMAAAGLLSPMLNPDLQCVKAGLEMVSACADLNSSWTVRVGVHSGELVAGVIGTKKFLFDIWGDTVNTASRVESSGVPNGVSVSRDSWKKISHACLGESRGKVSVKGKGEMEMFLVRGLR